MHHHVIFLSTNEMASLEQMEKSLSNNPLLTWQVSGILQSKILTKWKASQSYTAEEMGKSMPT